MLRKITQAPFGFSSKFPAKVIDASEIFSAGRSTAAAGEQRGRPFARKNPHGPDDLEELGCEAQLNLLPQKKRPLKRAGVKSDGAKLYIRFLAGGMQNVVKQRPVDKANFSKISFPKKQCSNEL